MVHGFTLLRVDDCPDGSTGRRWVNMPARRGFLTKHRPEATEAEIAATVAEGAAAVRSL